MATKLKNLKLKKVDFVDEGANPEADIKITKRSDQEEEPTDAEKSLYKRFTAWLAKEFGTPVDKSARSFTDQIQIEAIENIQNEMWGAIYALRESLYSILVDEDLDGTAKSTAMADSLGQFSAAMGEYIGKWCTGTTADIAKRDDTSMDLSLLKADQAILSDMIKAKEPKGDLEEMLKIDKSKMTPEEVAAYENIVKKYAVDEPEVDPAANPVEKVKEAPAPEPVPQEVTPVDKSKEAPAPAVDEPEVMKSLRAQVAELRKFKEAAELKELTEVAKKYLPLGKKTDELAQTLKKMKAAGEEVYKTYVSGLDEMLCIQEKSGILSEIGKSTSGTITVGKSASEAKIEQIAKKYREDDSRISYEDSIAMAWENNPDLIDEYETERSI